MQKKINDTKKENGESTVEGGQETLNQRTVEQAMQKCLTGDDLTSFLIRSACSNPSITYYLYWYLKVEVSMGFIFKTLSFFVSTIYHFSSSRISLDFRDIVMNFQVQNYR